MMTFSILLAIYIGPHGIEDHCLGVDSSLSRRYCGEHGLGVRVDRYTLGLNSCERKYSIVCIVNDFVARPLNITLAAGSTLIYSQPLCQVCCEPLFSLVRRTLS